MSEATEAQPLAAPAAPDKRAQTEAVLQDLLRLMGYPARLDFKDAADGGLSVAMHFDADAPFAQPGKRSFVIDSMQFLLNKVVNRPNTEKRWISLGVGAHPEPRPARPQTPPAAVAVAAVAAVAAPRNSAPANGASAPRHATPANGGPAAPAPRGRPQPVAAASRPAPPDEASVEVKADPLMAKLGVQLAEKSARHGRFLGVMLLDNDDRARLVQAGKGVKGQSVRVEGEGYNRRVVFAPDSPAPMPKKSALPVLDLEEDDEE